jgi:hypothetical protein
MKVAWRFLLAMMATLGLGGCRALSTGSLAPKPPPLAERTFDVETFVAEHNRNVERIQSLQARPTITLGGKFKGGADGRLAMERPRNFKLELLAFGSPKADIGSNDEEFWFWVQNENDKSVNWCRYEDLESSAVPITYQPDWIIAALGLKEISAEEAAGIKVRTKGTEAGTTALVFPSTPNGNETYTREIIVWNKTRRIKEHRLYAGKASNLVAQAEVSNFEEIEIGSQKTGDRDSCYLPGYIKLDWKREQLILEVALRKIVVNQFDKSLSASLFVEPKIPGYTRVNLADLNRGHPRDSRTTVRQTLPQPEPRSRVKLGRPLPLSDETTMVPRVGPGNTPTNRNRTTSQLEELVSAPMPTAPDSSIQTAGAMWTRADALGVER